MRTVLIIDDRPALRAVLAQPLRRAGHQVHEATSLADGLRRLRASSCDVVFVDPQRRTRESHPLVPTVLAEAPGAAVIAFACSGAVGDAAQAIKAGARDYIQLPIDHDALVHTLQRALDPPASPLPGCSRPRVPLGRGEDVVVADPMMTQLFDRVRRVAEVDCAVLITGESGTGKEVVARSLFAASRRRGGRFIPVNCGAIPDALAESELFGYHKGAFTGAVSDRRGLIEEAEDGVLFLDEIGETSPRVQVALLRFLDSGELRRVGDSIVRHVNTRVIAATNRPLERAVHEGSFRRDLFYRLNVVSLQVPPLRERPNDIPVLAQHFLRGSTARLQRDATGFSSDALQRMRRYHWPGNVRELQNAVESAVVMATGSTVEVDDLPAAVAEMRRDPDGEPRVVDRDLAATVEQRFAGNRTHAAAAMGISRTTLWRRLRSKQAADATAQPLGPGAADQDRRHAGPPAPDVDECESEDAVPTRACLTSRA